MSYLMGVQAVCVLRGEKPDWDTAKRILGEPNFMRSLLEFDKDNIPDSYIRKLRRYVASDPWARVRWTGAVYSDCEGLLNRCACSQDDPAFTPEAVAKQSCAAQSLCLWARAMDTYHRVSAAVVPKRAKLRRTEAILAAADAQLHEKQDTLRVRPWTLTCIITPVAEALSAGVLKHAVGRLPSHACVMQGVEERVAALQLQLTGVLEEQDALRQQRETTEKRLTRAARLTDALGEEGLRWRRTAEALQARPTSTGHAAQLCEEAMQHNFLGLRITAANGKC